MTITLNNVSMSYGGRTLFENIEAAFNPGHRYGLTGPNGAGKSTLFKIVMGRVAPTSGMVALPEKVGFLRQDIEHFHDMVVRDAVLMSVLHNSTSALPANGLGAREALVGLLFGVTPNEPRRLGNVANTSMTTIRYEGGSIGVAQSRPVRHGAAPV